MEHSFQQLLDWTLTFNHNCNVKARLSLRVAGGAGIDASIITMQLGEIESSAVGKDAMLASRDTTTGVLWYGHAILCPSVCNC